MHLSSRRNYLIETLAASKHRYDINGRLIENFSPEAAGQLAAFLAHAAEMFAARAGWPQHDQKLGTLGRSIRWAVDDVARSVEHHGLTRKQAILRAATNFKVSAATIEVALRVHAKENAKISRIEMRRLLEAGWSVEQVATYLNMHKTSVYRRKRLLAAQGAHPEENSGPASQDETERG